MMNKSWYGRKWLLEIHCLNGDMLSMGHDGISGIPEAKVTFDINYPGYQGWAFSEFTIYNPNTETEKKIINEGSRVYFHAGYSDEETGKYGLIFSGTVFQAMYTREGVTDYKLTLLCMDGERLFKDNMVAFSMIEGYRHQTLVNAIATRARNPIEVGKVTSKVEDVPLPRGVTVFGSPDHYLRQAMRYNNTQMFMVNEKLNIMHLSDPPQGDCIAIGPDSGLIGAPTQVDYGVSFRSLLNPELVIAYPPKWVKLDMSGVNIVQKKAVMGSENPVPMIPEDGYFKVGGVRHCGDTRGDTWYTDVTGYAIGGRQDLQLTTPEFLEYPDSYGG